MGDVLPGTCSLCLQDIPHAAGSRFVEVTPERDGSPRLFHVDCFVASRTGTARDGDIWTYRIVAAR